jgi:hypothetical protein
MFLVIFMMSIFPIATSAGNSNRDRMNHIFRLVAAAAVAVVLVSAVSAQAGPRSRPLDEDAALSLFVRTIKHNRVYARRISLDCITYGTEETTDAYFQFVLRENHNAKCGGDPQTSPVVDRYRVYRRSGKIEWWEPIEDDWAALQSGANQVALGIRTFGNGLSQ